jgi:UDP-perosamine 4-acetyltransferase
VRDGVIVLGEGGHAKVCIELLQAMGRTVDWCIGVSDALTCLGIPVLHGDEQLVRLRAEGYRLAFVAIGSNSLRHRLATMALALDFELINAISPLAVISPSARLGFGIAVMAGVVINADAIIENLAIINTGACVDHDCKIREGAHVGPTCGLAGSVIVGPYSFLGIGTKVIPGAVIGANVVIGAGAVVINDIPDGMTAIGVPARTMLKQNWRNK